MTPIQVLLVDDEPDIREILKDMLCLKGCNVAEAANGIDALKLLSNQKFDLIFSDIDMPGMNGIEFFRKYIKMSQAKYSLRFLLSGDLNPSRHLSETDKTIHLVHGFISKPFNENQLDEALKSIHKG
jgi:CheY-like chemotaxis protein